MKNIRTAAVSWVKPFIARCLMTLTMLALSSTVYAGETDLSVAVTVNGDPISTHEVEQRQRFMAITSGFSDEMKSQIQATIKKPETQEKFREFVQSRPQPRSKEEQLALQREFMTGLQKTIQARVMSSRMSSLREKAIEELIDEKLMIQDAKANGITVSEDDVMQQFVKKTDDGKTVSNATELFEQLRNAGVDPKTFKEKKRAQIAWIALIRRRFSFRIQNAAAVGDAEETSSTEKALYDLHVVKLAMPASTDQKQVGKLWSSADNLRQRFSTCANLDAQAKLINGSLVKYTKKTLDAFSPEARVMIVKSSAGQITPPVILKDSIEIYAVCNKTAAVAASPQGGKKAPEEKGDKRQQEFQIQAKGHMNTLRKTAHIERR